MENITETIPTLIDQCTRKETTVFGGMMKSGNGQPDLARRLEKRPHTICPLSIHVRMQLGAAKFQMVTWKFLSHCQLIHLLEQHPPLDNQPITSIHLVQLLLLLKLVNPHQSVILSSLDVGGVITKGIIKMSTTSSQDTRLQLRHSKFESNKWLIFPQLWGNHKNVLNWGSLEQCWFINRKENLALIN